MEKLLLCDPDFFSSSFSFCEMGVYVVGQTGLEFAILLSQPLRSWIIGTCFHAQPIISLLSTNPKY
jgi:hypothetical protein